MRTRRGLPPIFRSASMSGEVAVVIPLFAGHLLVMPGVSPGIGIHRNDRGDEQVVAAAGAAVTRGSRASRCRCRSRRDSAAGRRQCHPRRCRRRRAPTTCRSRSCAAVRMIGCLDAASAGLPGTV